MKAWLNKVEHYHNLASDLDLIWFPFLFLKLKPHEVMTQGRIWVMVACFSTYCNGAYIIKRLLFGDELSLEVLGGAQLVCMGIFIVWFNLVTRPLWNRRARRLMVGESQL